jgi:ParB family chromosome partitioning protein
MPAQKKGLGKGLDVLFQSYDTSYPADSAEPERTDQRFDESAVMRIDINDIDPNRSQPRSRFDEEKIQGLADSIRQHGLVQPILLKPLEGDRYMLVAGERRWRAARLAGLTRIPSIVKRFSDQEMLEIALVENLQRENLNPMEEAEGIRQLMERFGLTQERVGERLGKSRPAVANSLRLLSLPEEIQFMVREGELSAGHARAVMAIEEAGAQMEAARRIAAKGLSVREAEAMTKKPTKEKTPKAEEPKSLYIMDLEDQLCERLGTRVHIQPGDKKGIIQIEYYSDQDLQRILDIIQ